MSHVHKRNPPRKRITDFDKSLRGRAEPLADGRTTAPTVLSATTAAVCVGDLFDDRASNYCTL